MSPVSLKHIDLPIHVKGESDQKFDYEVVNEHKTEEI